jgi:hypothetical protein
MQKLLWTLYLLLRDERIVFRIEKCPLAHIQLEKPVFPLGLKAFHSFYFNNLYSMHFSVCAVVGPRSR